MMSGHVVPPAAVFMGEQGGAADAGYCAELTADAEQDVERVALLILPVRDVHHALVVQPHKELALELHVRRHVRRAEAEFNVAPLRSGARVVIARHDGPARVRAQGEPRARRPGEVMRLIEDERIGRALARETQLWAVLGRAGRGWRVMFSFNKLAINVVGGLSCMSCISKEGR